MLVHHYDRTHDERGRPVRLGFDETVDDDTVRQLREALASCGIVIPDSVGSADVPALLSAITVAALNAANANDALAGRKLPRGVTPAPDAPVMMSLDAKIEKAVRDADRQSIKDFFALIN